MNHFKALLLFSFLAFASFTINEKESHISTFLVVFHFRVVGGLSPCFPWQLCEGSEDWEQWGAIGLPGAQSQNSWAKMNWSGRRVKTLGFPHGFSAVCGKKKVGGLFLTLQSHVPATGGQEQHKLLIQPAALCLTCKNPDQDFRSRKGRLDGR